MRLNSVSIKRYRSIEDAGLAACGGFNVLIGRNNSGKSNILSALRAFFACAHDGVATITPPIRELSRSLLKFAERGGRASYPQFTAAQGIPT